eukprot:2491011-Prymnesium_polylepis.1
MFMEILTGTWVVLGGSCRVARAAGAGQPTATRRETRSVSQSTRFKQCHRRLHYNKRGPSWRGTAGVHACRASGDPRTSAAPATEIKSPRN